MAKTDIATRLPFSDGELLPFLHSQRLWQTKEFFEKMVFKLDYIPI
jgi:hypothetical protein